MNIIFAALSGVVYTAYNRVHVDVIRTESSNFHDMVARREYCATAKITASEAEMPRHGPCACIIYRAIRI